MARPFGLTCCSRSFMPESKLSHKLQAHHGLRSKPRHHRGKNQKNFYSDSLQE